MTRSAKCYKMTLEQVMTVIQEIIDRGNDAEVRRGRGGTYIVYEIQKNKAPRPVVGRPHTGA